ncbi:MAG: hypothetical protein ACOCQM_05950 [Natronomonas sp.]
MVFGPVLWWVCFYAGLCAVASLAHYGRDRSERLSDRRSLAVVCLTAALPPVVALGTPGVGVFGRETVRTLSDFVVTFVAATGTGVAFGTLAFLGYSMLDAEPRTLRGE